MVCSMEVNMLNTLLFTADNSGFVYVWNIDGYCLDHGESEPPECEFETKYGLFVKVSSIWLLHH